MKVALPLFKYSLYVGFWWRMLKSSDYGAGIEVRDIKRLDKTVTFYNIEVDGNHDYFVTKSSILVHNKNITEMRGAELEGSIKQ